LLQQPGPFVISGKVEEEFGAVTMTVEHLRKLGPAR
jgi:hypothetical protein